MFYSNMYFIRFFLLSFVFWVGCSFFVVTKSSASLQGMDCPPDQYRVKAHHRRAYVKADGTFVSAAHVASHCKGRSPTYVFIKTRLRAGAPRDWPTNRGEHSRVWGADEAERLVEALEALPGKLRSLPVKGFFRMKKSKDWPNPASSSDGEVVLYDSAFESKANLARILAHELAHLQYRELSGEKKTAYAETTGWFVVHPSKGPSDPSRYYRRKSGFVDSDGELHPGEDFSNNVEWYLFDGAALLRTTPQAHSWIKAFFGDSFKVGK